MDYKLAVFEIRKIFCISVYYVSALSLHTEFTDSMIHRMNRSPILSLILLQSATSVYFLYETKVAHIILTDLSS